MPATEELPLAEQRELRDQCTVFLAGHGPVTAAGLLAGTPADTVTDRYGSGGVVAELEIEVGGLVGRPAAVFCPAERWLSSRCCGSMPTGGSEERSSSTEVSLAQARGGGLPAVAWSDWVSGWRAGLPDDHR